MQSVLKLSATVLPGSKIEIVAPELREGEQVEVLLVWPASPRARPARLSAEALAFFDSLPAGPRPFATWEEYEKHLEEERNAWGRPAIIPTGQTAV